ncbi:hypothetical protein, partial [Escherichia coli]|uniref:hypothetical protein n=1 Tax=Escherichia coli TaxID=562 RepID=UPI0019D647E4
ARVVSAGPAATSQPDGQGTAAGVSATAAADAMHSHAAMARKGIGKRDVSFMSFSVVRSTGFQAHGAP